MKSVVVLMTVHNRKDKTLRCLQCLHQQKGIGEDYRVEVFLTDDGCTDGTPETVLEAFPDVHVIRGDGNLYWNRGMLYAWKEAAKSDFDYFLWLNDDTYLFPNALQMLLETSDKVGHTAVVVGDTCSTGSSCTITYGGRDKNGTLVIPCGQPQECYMINGNIVLIPQEVFLRVGFNDSHYKHSLGDYDYSHAIHRHGFRMMVAPEILGQCDEHPSKDVWKDASYPLRARWHDFFSPTGANPYEFFYYRRKNYGLLRACLTFISNFVHVCFPRLWNSK